MAVKPKRAQPYSRGQWASVNPKQRKSFGGSYDKYVNWWNKTVSPRLPQRTSTSSSVSGSRGRNLPVDALAAYDQNQLFKMAQDQINANFNPLIDHYLASLDARGKSSMDRLRGATGDFVRDVSRMAPTIGASYDKAEAGMRATNQGIVDFLGATGQGTAGAATQQLQNISAPEASVQAQAGTLGTLGTGITGGALGRGSIEENVLNTNRAADTVEAALYPKHAAEYGMNAASDLESALNAERAEGLADFRSKIPGMVQSTYQDLLDRELQKAIAREGFSIDKAKSTTAKTKTNDFAPYNTPGGTMVYNKKTGAWTFVPGTKPKPKSKAAKKDPLTGVTEGSKAAREIHDSMMEKFSSIDRPAPLTPYYDMEPKDRIKAKQGIINSSRKEALAAINGWLKSVYPNKPEAWVEKQQINMLRAAGFRDYATQLEGGSAATQHTQAAGAQGYGGTQSQDGPKVDRAYTSAAKSASNYAKANTPRAQAIAGVVKVLQANLKGYPHTKIIALANRAVNAAYGG